MAGAPQTSEFMLSTATIMIGPMADLFKLNTAEHSVGGVKNVHFTGNFEYNELKFGVQQSLAASEKSNIEALVSAEVYEFTGKNLAYALGLTGTEVVTSVAPLALKTAIVGDDGTPITTVVATAASDLSANYSTGDWIMIQERSGDYDVVHVGKITGAPVYAVGATSLTFTLASAYGIKDGTNFTSANIYKMSKMDIGSQDEAPYFAMKVVGVLPDGRKAIPMYFPKVKITKGADFAFSSENWGNMPMEFKPHTLNNTDATSDIRTIFGKNLGMMLRS